MKECQPRVGRSTQIPNASQPLFLLPCIRGPDELPTVNGYQRGRLFYTVSIF